MSLNAAWQETESEIWRPGMWLVLTVGLVFAMIGCIGLVIGVGPAVGMPVWARHLIIGTFAIAGCAILGWAIVIRLWPVRIRHALVEILPELVNEPVLREGSTVRGRLTHELSENDAGWEFRPMTSIWRNDRWFLFGFGGPFLVVFAGVLTWYFSQAMNWAVAGVLAVFLTTLSGGTCFVLIGLIMNGAHRRLSTLSIPRDRTDLVLDSAFVPDAEPGDLAAGLHWIFLGGSERQQPAWIIHRWSQIRQLGTWCVFPLSMKWFSAHLPPPQVPDL